MAPHAPRGRWGESQTLMFASPFPPLPSLVPLASAARQSPGDAGGCRRSSTGLLEGAALGSTLGEGALLKSARRDREVGLAVVWCVWRQHGHAGGIQARAAGGGHGGRTARQLLAARPLGQGLGWGVQVV
jgi:hypothetical protein